MSLREVEGSPETELLAYHPLRHRGDDDLDSMTMILILLVDDDLVDKGRPLPINGYARPCNRSTYVP